MGGRTPSPFGGCTFVLGGGAIRGRGIRLVGVTVSHKQSAVFYLFPSSSCSTSLFCFVRFGCVLFCNFCYHSCSLTILSPIYICMYIFCIPLYWAAMYIGVLILYVCMGGCVVGAG